MRIGIRGKLFLGSLGLVVVSLVVSEVWVASSLSDDLEASIESDLFTRARLLARAAAASPFDRGDSAGWDALADELGALGPGRVTVVRKDGVVLGDSEIGLPALAAVESHGARPEVRHALASGRGADTRLSSTLGTRMKYVAVPFSRGGETFGVVRVARPLGEIDRAVARLRGVVLVAGVAALIVAVLMSSLAAAFLSRRARALTTAARKMGAGELATRTRESGQDELGELGRALDNLATGLEQTLSELRAESDLSEAVLRGMREGVLVVDARGRVVLANTALREMLRLGSEVIGRSPLEVFRNAELRQIIDAVALGKSAPPTEVELDLPERRRLLIHASALRGVPGGPGGVLAVFIDVTNLRRLENVRKEFVANVSHELRTPIATVSAAAEMLRRTGELSEPAAELLSMIERNAERLRHLVEDLLDLSRIEARGLPLSLEPLAPGEVLQGLVDPLRARAAARHIDLSIKLPADLPPVRADRRALEQVLGNLLDNALKYASDAARIEVSGDAQGGRVRLRVADSGPGIEARHLPRLFERFYRVDAGRSRELGGTGLGLSIVKHLVESMGGTVRVDSIVGSGTTFDVTLPAA